MRPVAIASICLIKGVPVVAVRLLAIDGANAIRPHVVRLEVNSLKMRWVDARPVLAQMINGHPVSDFAL